MSSTKTVPDRKRNCATTCRLLHLILKATDPVQKEESYEPQNTKASSSWLNGQLGDSPCWAKGA